MTVSQAIIQWLKTFVPEDARKIKHIDTDLMHGDVNYSLVKEPTTEIRRFLTGSEMHKEYYQIRVRLNSLTNTDCVDNGAYMEALTAWVDAQDKAKNFPDLGAPGITVKSIRVSSSFYLGATQDNKAVYMMTICIEYFKKGV